MKIFAPLLIALLCVMLGAQSAEARRFAIPLLHFGDSESIDPVYDLPNAAPFVRDGDFIDVGYLNSRYGDGYVLYHGNRYSKLDDRGLAALTDLLGFDPTAKHRAQYAIDHKDEIARAKAEAAAERAHHDAEIASGRLFEPMPGESHEAFVARAKAAIAKQRASAGPAPPVPEALKQRRAMGATGFWLFLVFLIVLIFAGRIYSGVFRLARAVSGNAPPDWERGGETDHLSFDQEVAKRLEALRAGESPQGPVPGPAVRGFGRKAV